MSLDSLFLPLTPASFATECFDREHRLLRNPGRRFDDVLAPADLDALLEYAGPKVRIVRNGQSPFAVNPETVGARNFVDSLYKAYREGATLAVEGVERSWPTVGRLCGELAEWMGGPVRANLYVTPSGTQGFPPHHDTHDVLVLQIAGHKVWRLYDARIERPLHDDTAGTPADTTGPVREEIVLEPGDVLYVPRGVVHEARCLDDASMHLTVGLYAYRVVDVLCAALRGFATRDARLRALLPTGGIDSEDVNRELLARFSDALSEATPADAKAEMRKRFSNERPAVAAARFAHLDAPPEITLDTEMRRISGVTCRVESAGGGASLEFMGTAVRGPDFLVSAFRFMAERTSFQPRHLPDDIDDNGKLVLMRRLVREGLLFPVGGAS